MGKEDPVKLVSSLALGLILILEQVWILLGFKLSYILLGCIPLAFVATKLLLQPKTIHSSPGRQILGIQ